MQVSRSQNVQVSRFARPKTLTFPGLDPPKRAGFQVSTCRFPGLDPPPPPKTLTIPGLDPPKRAGFQVWTLQTWFLQGLEPPPKRAGFRVWTPKTCRFPGLDPPKRAGSCWKPGLDPPNVQVSRFGPQKTCQPAHLGGSKPANVHVLGCTCFGGSKPGNLHVSGVQTWKPGRLGGPNLETCPQGKVLGSRNISEGSRT